MGNFTSEDGRVKCSSQNDSEYILDDRWSFRVPEGMETEFNGQYSDVANITNEASLIMRGLKSEGRDLCVIAVEPTLMFLQPDSDIADCRHDTNVAWDLSAMTISIRTKMKMDSSVIRSIK